MLRLSTIQPATLELLKSLMKVSDLSNFNLVGGTALALQLGHRLSIDLDLIGDEKFDPDILFSSLSQLGETKLNFKSNNTLGLFINDIKVDIIRYSFPLIKPIIHAQSIRIVSIEDIAAMKLSAIAKRGSKKDFWDLYFILKKFSFQDLFNFYESKFGKESLFFVIKSLTYFDDANLDPDPIKIINVTWENVKSTIQSNLKNYL